MLQEIKDSNGLAVEHVYVCVLLHKILLESSIDFLLCTC